MNRKIKIEEPSGFGWKDGVFMLLMVAFAAGLLYLIGGLARGLM
jgi:hypothetical protein